MEALLGKLAVSAIFVVSLIAICEAQEKAEPGAENPYSRGISTAPFVFEGTDCWLSSLADAADPAAERVRLTESLGKLDKDIAALETRLNNPGYADKAPAKLVQQTRDQLSQKIAEREATKSRLAELK